MVGWMEINLELVGALILIGLGLAGLFANILQRLTKIETCVDPDDGDRIIRVETKVDLLLEWVACLNGEVSNEKFLKKLKRVTKELYKDQYKKTEF